MDIFIEEHRGNTTRVNWSLINRENVLDVMEGMTGYHVEEGVTSVWCCEIHGLEGKGFEDERKPLETSRIVVDLFSAEEYHAFCDRYRHDPAAVVQELRAA